QDMQRPDRMVTWGPRWRSLKRVHLGARAGLAVLELPDEFAADLDAFGLHPALLDAATAVLTGFAGGAGRYRPLAYQRITIIRPLVKTIYSYVRYQEDAAAHKETLSCDITLLDEDGQALVEIAEFTLKRVHAPPAGSARMPTPDVLPTEAPPGLVGAA